MPYVQWAEWTHSRHGAYPRPEKLLLNLREDFMEPLFGKFSSILIVPNVSLQLRHTIFSRRPPLYAYRSIEDRRSVFVVPIGSRGRFKRLKTKASSSQPPIKLTTHLVLWSRCHRYMVTGRQ